MGGPRPHGAGGAGAVADAWQRPSCRAGVAGGSGIVRSGDGIPPGRLAGGNPVRHPGSLAQRRDLAAHPWLGPRERGAVAASFQNESSCDLAAMVGGAGRAPDPDDAVAAMRPSGSGFSSSAGPPEAGSVRMRRPDRGAGEFMTLIGSPSSLDAMRVAFRNEMQCSANFPQTRQSIGAASAGCFDDMGFAPAGVAGQ